MKISSRNVLIILSLALSYSIIQLTVGYWSDLIQAFLGVRLEEEAITKYKFPVVILAFLIFPVLSGLKKS